MNIKEWVYQNTKGLMPEQSFTDEELDHVTMGCEHLYEWATTDRTLGHFLAAVVDNNFRVACTKADIINRKALYLYAMFMFNRMPADKLR